ncbi:hypothetical protein [Roseovarius sp. M141]|uniref:hypothetical protein n=1 Tax=Roseovarius sp. M141 TaxID=2583806 RepID=UPI0020CEE6C5|nr:hypothetical protein [Roseovarius sp. M141]MCQ0092432.1 hypothetical protein [Roseovarius sp. M141]
MPICYDIWCPEAARGLASPTPGHGLLAGGNGYSKVIYPAGQILHRGNVQEEMIPIEVDFDLVRRQRREGALRLG